MRITRISDGAVAWEQAPRSSGIWHGRINGGLAFLVERVGSDHYELTAWSPDGPAPVGRFRRWARVTQVAEMIVVVAP